MKAAARIWMLALLVLPPAKASGQNQDCPKGAARVATAYGSYCETTHTAIDQHTVQQETTAPLANSDVVKMVTSGLAEDTIILAIRRGPTKFDTSPDALIALKKSGVSDNILRAMLTAISGPSGSISRSGQDAKLLLESVVKAFGGPEKLASLRSSRWRSNVTEDTPQGKVSYQFERVTVWPDSFYSRT